MALLPALPAAAAPESAPARVLVFDLEIVDTSGEPPAPDHPERLRRTTAVLRDGLAASGPIAVVGIRDAVLNGVPPSAVPASIRACNGCEIDLARAGGFDFVVTGAIHKISTLVLNARIIIREVGSGAVAAEGNADFRGDNERAWRHTVEWLLRHRLIPGQKTQ